MQLFDGLTGRVVARIMAATNADMERQAIDALAPEAHHTVLAIGFGPGVGIEILAKILVRGRVEGADPSRAMLGAAERRNRAAIQAGRVRLCLAAAHALPLEDASVDGAIAVNSIQLWEPFNESVAELARVLRPGAAFVALTHDWALKKHGAVDDWLAGAEATLGRGGLVGWRTWPGKARSGGVVGLGVTKAAADVG